MTDATASQSVLGIDVGEQRIGVARGRLDTRLASPLTTLESPERFADDIAELCRQEQAGGLVIGLPRGLDGQDTAQTGRARAFGEELERQLSAGQSGIQVYWIDEALTSHKAETELQSRGKPYSKGDIDALAATYILEDFLKDSHG